MNSNSQHRKPHIVLHDIYNEWVHLIQSITHDFCEIMLQGKDNVCLGLYSTRSLDIPQKKHSRGHCQELFKSRLHC